MSGDKALRVTNAIYAVEDRRPERGNHGGKWDVPPVEYTSHYEAVVTSAVRMASGHIRISYRRLDAPGTYGACVVHTDGSRVGSYGPSFRRTGRVAPDSLLAEICRAATRPAVAATSSL